MSASERISNLLSGRIEAGDFPSAVYLVAEMGEIVFEGALGNAVIEPEIIGATTDTIYDLASLTKVLVTGLLYGKLLGRGDVGIDDRLAKYFSQFSSGEKSKITLRHLLTHTSGFAAWKPLYLLTGKDNLLDAETKKERIIDLIATAPLDCPTGTKVVYSDQNFILLGYLLEKIFRESLGVLAKAEILGPLGLGRTFFNPPADLKPKIAASEHGNSYEKNTCVENGYDVSGYAWREDVIWGEVHDGNAYYLNGVAGHAGIFSTVRETLKIAQQFLPASTEILMAESCAMFRQDLTQGLNEARSIAFQLAATEASTASEKLSPSSFGHLGFTGTSLWIEPETERVFILLTNRSHAHSLPFVNINPIRREFHRIAVSELGSR